MAINTAKQLSYAEAWRRINNATAQGFYFEVVTLCESILSDRLLSYVTGVNKSSKASIKSPFSNLIREWRKLAAGQLPAHGKSDLGAAVDTWRNERNAIVHSLAKSAPGTATAPLASFIIRAQQTAEDGVKLAKLVSSWHRKSLAAHLQTVRTVAPARKAANPSLKRTSRKRTTA